jgi:hypothetical protein
MLEPDSNALKSKKLDEKEAELDQVLAALADGVDRLKNKVCAAREAPPRGRAPRADTPASGFDVRRLRKTRMVFQAMAEESLEDSRDDDPPKKGEVVKLPRGPVPRQRPRSGS